MASLASAHESGREVEDRLEAGLVGGVVARISALEEGSREGRGRGAGGLAGGDGDGRAGEGGEEREEMWSGHVCISEPEEEGKVKVMG